MLNLPVRLLVILTMRAVVVQVGTVSYDFSSDTCLFTGQWDVDSGTVMERVFMRGKKYFVAYSE
jgi:hypothetical protein